MAHESGIQASDLAAVGVTVVSGRPFAGSATNELLLGWRAAQNLGLRVGGRLRLDGQSLTVVGIYSTGQALGDTGAMLPLTWFQDFHRQPGQLTLLFLRVTPGTALGPLQARIDHDNPQLVTIRTLAQFGRADRSLALILAANRASAVLAIAIGAVVIMSAMTMSFRVERTREFDVLSALGWPPWRVGAMIIAEALFIGLIGAAAGVALSMVAVVQHLPSLAGVLHPEYTAANFGRVLFTAATMVLLGGLYPAVRAALLGPLEALRHG